MGSPFTPNARAGGTIAPYRFVKPTTADNTVAQTGDAEEAIGVTRGDNSEFDTANHAVSGEVVRLQDGRIMRVTCGDDVTAGDTLESDASGRAVTQAGGIPLGKALQSGAVGEIIEIFFHPVWADNGA